MAQIKDIAAKAGVSPATVSLVLNHKPGIGEETRNTVLRVAESLGYTKPKARRAQSAALQNVQFVIYKKHGMVVADTPFFAYVLEGVQAQAHKYGFNVLISYIDERAGKGAVQQQIESIVNSGCKGILLLATEMVEEDLKPFQAGGVPIVVVDNSMRGCNVDTVVMSNAEGACQAVCWLAQSGCRKIGHLQSKAAIRNFTERHIGYKQAMQELGLPAYPDDAFTVGSTPEKAYNDMKELLRSGAELPQAFFADNDCIALGALRALTEAGKTGPEDIAVIGFDDVPMSVLSAPPLTTVRVEKEYIGRAAVDRLAVRMEAPDIPCVKIEVRTALVVRASAPAMPKENHDLPI